MASKRHALAIVAPLLLLITLPSICVGSTNDVDPRLVGVPTNLTADGLYFSDRAILNTFLYPPETVTADAPYVVRYVLVQLIAGYDVSASCTSQSALSFLGVRLSLPTSVCSCVSHSILALTYELLASNFPTEAASLRLVLQHTNMLGTLPHTAQYWVTSHASRLNHFLLNDGWNAPSYKDQRPENDKYRPRNRPGVSPRSIVLPLRWQPATIDLGRGRSVSQQHVFPHLSAVKPLVLSRREFRSSTRRSRAPYRTRNARANVAPDDVRFVTEAARQVMAASDGASAADVARAAWWDSKLASTGIMNIFYATSMQLGQPALFAFLLGDMLAQHDAAVLAFRKKARHDLARPQPVIRGLLNEGFTSKLQAQPHAEFPSASAMLCAASLDHAAMYAEEEAGMQLPVFRGSTQKSVFLPNSALDVDVVLDTPAQGAAACAQSRITAGVHFQASINEGIRISRGIGAAAYQHVADLLEGEVPDDCERCGRF